MPTINVCLNEPILTREDLADRLDVDVNALSVQSYEKFVRLMTWGHATAGDAPPAPAPQDEGRAGAAGDTPRPARSPPDGPPLPEGSEKIEIKDRRLYRRFAYLTLFIFFIFPLVMVVLAAVFGGLLTLSEPGTTFTDGFLYVISNLLGMANPLTNYAPSGAAAAVVIDMYVAVAASVSLGVMLNIINLFEVPKSINKVIHKLIKNHTAVIMFALLVVIPIWNAALGAVLGCLLAFAEGWPVSTGMLYVTSNILGLGTPLTDVVPKTMGAKVIDVCISSISIGYIAIFADYVTALSESDCPPDVSQVPGETESNPSRDHGGVTSVGPGPRRRTGSLGSLQSMLDI